MSIEFIETYGAGDGNRTNPNEPNKSVTTRFSVQLESNGVKSCEGWLGPDAYLEKSKYWEWESDNPAESSRDERRERSHIRGFRSA
jgi:hypothetical protein